MGFSAAEESTSSPVQRSQAADFESVQCMLPMSLTSLMKYQSGYAKTHVLSGVQSIEFVSMTVLEDTTNWHGGLV
jgi:hypothetical protein